MTVTELLPLPERPDSLPELRERAKQLVDHADHETLRMVNPLLARLLHL
jgi:hypothetical protein